MKLYNIIRLYTKGEMGSEIIQTGLTLEDAKKYCDSKNLDRPQNGIVPDWVDIYEDEKGTEKYIDSKQLRKQKDLEKSNNKQDEQDVNNTLTKQSFKKDPFELVLFFIMTPMYSDISPWITIPMGFLQDIVLLVLIMSWSNSSSYTTAVRVPLSGGGILGALLAIGLLQSSLQFIYDNLYIAITILIAFYIYAFFAHKLPKFTWLNDPSKKSKSK